MLSFIKNIPHISKDYPVVISKFMSNAVEAEIDAVADGDSAIGVSIEHIEEAGVHSGDSTMVTPVRSDYTKKMKDVAIRIIRALDIKGPLNLQFIVKDGNVYVIELNLRASRSMPFSSKAIGMNLVDMALRGSLGRFDHRGFYEPVHKNYAVKSPQFSWLQMQGAYPGLGPEMKSTGESGAFGRSLSEALLKSWLGSQPNKIPDKKQKILVYGTNVKMLDAAAGILEKRFDILTTEDQYEIDGAVPMPKKSCVREISNGRIGLVFTDGNMPEHDFEIRRTAVDMNVPVVLNARLSLELAKALAKYENYEEIAGLL